MSLVPARQLSTDRLQTSGTQVTAVEAEEMAVEVSRIQLVNRGSNAATVEIYHDDDGTTFDEAALIFRESVAPGSTWNDCLHTQAPGTGLPVSPGGAIGIEATGTSPDVVVAIYGITEASTGT